MAWKLKEYERSMFTVFEVIDESGEVIKTFVADAVDYSEKKKKAQLMAAAPELLDIAEYSLKIVESLPCECDSYNGFTCKKHEWERKLRLVINKAKGSNQDG